MRGQVSIEYVMIIGISLLIIAPLLVISITTSRDYESDLNRAQIQRIAYDLAALADEVSYEGPPARRTATVYFPEGLTSVTTNGRFLIMNLSDDTVIASSGSTDLTWNLSVEAQGRRRIAVVARETDVLITST